MAVIKNIYRKLFDLISRQINLISTLKSKKNKNINKCYEILRTLLLKN